MIPESAFAILKPVVVTVSVLGALALAKRYAKPSIGDIKDAEMANTSLPSVVTVNVVMVCVGIVLAIGLHVVLVSANHYLAARDGSAVMVLYPSVAIWWLLPGFAALALAWEITFQVWCAINRKQAETYRAYSNLKSGFDSTKILRILAVVIALPIGIATVLALPIHTSLTDDAIHDGHFAKLDEVVLRYANASELIQFDGDKLRDGSFQPRAGILVRFKQGETWNSADTNDPKQEVDPALAELLVEKTGLTMQNVRLEPK